VQPQNIGCRLRALAIGDSVHKGHRHIRNRAARVGGAALAVALVLAGFALAAEQPTSTTVPDAAFGEGGTRQSVLNERQELVVEVWRDRDGIVREQHENAGGGEEYWGFFFQDGSSSSNWGGGIIAIRPMERPAGRWELRVYSPGNLTLKEASFLTREELESELAHWRGQMRGWVNNFIRGQDPR
jgi:hypothetical protein